ncbi:preprotein translocase subunit SecG [Pseudomarimonas salicorniae]|uniref:Protein-export membrane protein SecG n=1 Tax=Pseudomarimonas salicorniae TaxID=2933270 RepID=A0ABT0GKX0_9GAMM|nr:preprotein translocase subunit SecG [Lysobacter sp. CAU 1642]MCK7594687.1 preprotein translocase subunit SecG [Lysobacter sp. CAU 1642]
MLLTFANILYVLVAAGMIVLILLQRGAGAAAGSGFGGGASATVFGARGSANFLSKSTAVLATLFFVISMGMAMYASRMANLGPATDDLGVMGALPAAAEVPSAPVDPAPASSELPAANEVAPPAANDGEVPVAAEPAAGAVENEAESEKSE